MYVAGEKGVRLPDSRIFDVAEDGPRVFELARGAVGYLRPSDVGVDDMGFVRVAAAAPLFPEYSLPPGIGLWILIERESQGLALTLPTGMDVQRLAGADLKRIRTAVGALYERQPNGSRTSLGITSRKTCDRDLEIE